MRRRLFLAVLATAAATPSDLNVWFADPAGDVGAPPEEDTCYASTAFGQEYDAQAGCGAAAAVNGVALPADSYSDVTFIGNARNAIFITTSTWESADIGSASQYNVSIALQVSSESDDEVVLCSEAAMLREQLMDGGGGDGDGEEEAVGASEGGGENGREAPGVREDPEVSRAATMGVSMIPSHGRYGVRHGDRAKEGRDDHGGVPREGAVIEGDRAGDTRDGAASEQPGRDQKLTLETLDCWSHRALLRLTTRVPAKRKAPVQVR